MYQYKNNQLPISFNNIYQYNHQIHPNRLTRKSHEIYISKAKNQFTNALPIYQFPRIWNNVPVDVQNSKTLKRFSKKLKSDTIKNYLENVKCINPHCNQCTGH